MKALNRLWGEQKLCIIMIKDILLYMNKNYVPKVKLKPVEQMQTSQFKHYVLLHPQLKHRLITLLLQDVAHERNGKMVERTQLRSAVHMLLEVGVHSRKIYEQEFEAPFLAETSEYYRLEANQLITVSSCPQYLAFANKRLKQEYDRVQTYLSPSSEAPLIKVFLEQFLSEEHTTALLEMESSGLGSMIRNQKMQDLHLVYTMCVRRPESFELLRRKLAEFILTEGGKLVADELLKIEDFIAQLMHLRESIYQVFSSAMDKDPSVDMTIKLAFEKICNVDSKIPRGLVLHLDDVFKKEAQALHEDEMAERLDRVIQIFRFLQDKDVFEGLYTASLAKRLLEARGINDEAERVLLLKLKEECGFAFTQRLEVMYKDVKLSEELTRDFQQTQTYQQLQPLELSLKVLTTGHWPLEQKEQPPVSLPRELSSAMAAFTAFYQHRFNNVRTLHWRLS